LISFHLIAFPIASEMPDSIAQKTLQYGYNECI